VEETNKENKMTFEQNIKKNSQKSFGCPLTLITILCGAHCRLGYLGERNSEGRRAKWKPQNLNAI
jgi:hypothetical protein